MVAGATGIDLFLLVVALRRRRHAPDPRAPGDHPAARARARRRRADQARPGGRRDRRDRAAARWPSSPASCRWSRCRRAPAPGWTSCATRSTARPRRVASRAADGPVRLPVDRAFTLRGIGTVVTGTLWSGTRRAADAAGGRAGRAPGAGAQRAGARPAGATRLAPASGWRVALVGAERSEAPRGATLATPGALQADLPAGVPARGAADRAPGTAPRRACDRPPRHGRDSGDRRRARRRRAAAGAPPAMSSCAS